MSEFKYEIGAEFETPWNCFRKIVARCESVDGGLFYWTEDASGCPCTYMQEDVDDWTPIVPFFKVGDTFEHGAWAGKVLFVSDEGDRLSAFVLYRDQVGKKWTESVTAYTYRMAENIKHAQD